jgi:hypothetical protein
MGAARRPRYAARAAASLVDFDLIGTVKVGTVGVDDPLLLWVGGPTATSDVATYDSLWVRLVDLPEALQDRTWSAPCDVVIEVADTMAPWNTGSWRIRADDAGEAPVEKTTAESDYAWAWTRWERRTSGAATWPHCSAAGS